MQSVRLAFLLTYGTACRNMHAPAFMGLVCDSRVCKYRRNAAVESATCKNAERQRCPYCRTSRVTCKDVASHIAFTGAAFAWRSAGARERKIRVLARLLGKLAAPLVSVSLSWNSCLMT